VAAGKKKNAGAGGIDKVTIQDFEYRKGELLEIIYSRLKADMFLLSLFNLAVDWQAVCLADTSRYVGRGSL